MNNLMNASLAVLAVTLNGCSSVASREAANAGRVIEFKSGPEGFGTRTFFYEGKNEVIAIDAQFTPDLAKKSIAHLRQFTQKPISWLVITHPNPDKFNGASVFKSEGARIVASQATADAIPGVHAYKEYFFVEMAKMFKKGTYPQPTSVDQVFRGEMDLVLSGGERLLLKELSAPGVASTQTVVHVPSQNSLFVGDLVHHKAHAWLEGGIVNGKATPTIDGWISDLHEIQKMFPKTIVYGGRGETGVMEQVASEQIDYLKKARQLVRDTVKSGNEKELTQRFEKTFPGYALPYMIEYGAYGLVQAEAANSKKTK